MTVKEEEDAAYKRYKDYYKNVQIKKIPKRLNDDDYNEEEEEK
jgi:hypothetical protein